MNTDAIKRFLTVLSSASKLERGQLYQLVHSAEVSYLWRDIQSQRDIGLALQSFAYPFNQVGKYYESVYLFRSGQYQKARETLESIAESAPTPYRSRALLSLSAVEESLGRFEESLRLRLHAASGDPVTMLESQWGIATLRSLEGDHRVALRDFEFLMPLAQIVGKSSHPVYFKFLNSYALELSETGRTEEAAQVANVIASSPLIGRYREWQETVAAVEAKRKRSSMIAVPHELNLKYSDARVQAGIDFMNANFHRKIALDEIAEVVNSSPANFSHLFKIETEITPVEYLIRLRMKKARELLKTTFLSVKQVMAASGYNSKSHFTRHFKRQFGVTPSEYRKRRVHRHGRLATKKQ